eukprot:4599171-Pyramimonas_sp.AAC.2
MSLPGAPRSTVVAPYWLNELMASVLVVDATAITISCGYLLGRPNQSRPRINGIFLNDPTNHVAVSAEYSAGNMYRGREGCSQYWLNKLVVLVGKDVKGNRVDVKGNRVDVKGNNVDAKGNSVDAKGSSVNVKGNSVDAKGSSVDVKGVSMSASSPTSTLVAHPYYCDALGLLVCC